MAYKTSEGDVVWTLGPDFLWASDGRTDACLYFHASGPSAPFLRPRRGNVGSGSRLPCKGVEKRRKEGGFVKFEVTLPAMHSMCEPPQY